MKYIWEEDDIKCGIYVCKPNQGDGTWIPTGWTAKWTEKIGFVGGRSNGVALVAMTDGMIGPKKTPQEMADQLNKDEMIPMPYRWLIATIEYLRD